MPPVLSPTLATLQAAVALTFLVLSLHELSSSSAPAALARSPATAAALPVFFVLLLAMAAAGAAALAAKALRACAGGRGASFPWRAPWLALLCLATELTFTALHASGSTTAWPLHSAAGHPRLVYPLRYATGAASNAHFAAAMAALLNISHPEDLLAVAGMVAAMGAILLLELLPFASLWWDAASLLACTGALVYLFILGRALAGMWRATPRALALCLLACAGTILGLYVGFAVVFFAARTCGGDGAGSCLGAEAEQRVSATLEAARAITFACTLAVTASAAQRAGRGAPERRRLSQRWTSGAAAAGCGGGGGGGGGGKGPWRLALQRYALYILALPVLAVLYGTTLRIALPAFTLPPPHDSAGAAAVAAAQGASLWLICTMAAGIFFFMPLALAASHAAEGEGTALPQAFNESARNGTLSFTEEPHVTMLFADAVGFTHAMACAPAVEVMAVMAELFQHFDALHVAAGVSKVETTGDEYFSVKGTVGRSAGGPRREVKCAAEQALAVGALALQLVAASREHAWPHGAPIDVRVGLHCGPATSGVLGDALPRWSVFGHAVALASRMESHGAPGCVHVSGAFAGALRGAGERAGAFRLLPREPVVDVKGVGPMETWWLSPA